MVSVRTATRETVNLCVLSGRQVSYALVVESELDRRVAAQPGQLSSLHSTALGKAIASQMEPDQVRAIVTEPLVAVTDRTITDLDEWMDALERTRRDGYALDVRENEPACRCVTVPLPSNYGPAALSVSGPVDRITMDLVPVIADHLTACAEVISADSL
jgi:IclR family acetate operon transcriptional repressor